jgi:hypothetical protein
MERFLFGAILASVFPMMVIGRQLFAYLDKIRTKRTTREIKSIVLLSTLASLGVINLLIVFPRIVLGVAVILIIISVIKFNKRTTWDKKNALALFLSGLTWLLYFALEFVMREWLRATNAQIRVELLFIAPILFFEAAIALCLASVDLTAGEKQELTKRSSR